MAAVRGRIDGWCSDRKVIGNVESSRVFSLNLLAIPTVLAHRTGYVLLDNAAALIEGRQAKDNFPDQAVAGDVQVWQGLIEIFEAMTGSLLAMRECCAMH
jgi:hypothetical protein